MPTIAEQWLEQGRQEGLVLGLEQGREEGREEGQREATLTLLRRILALRFEVEMNHFNTDFDLLDLAAITQLSEATFEVADLVAFEAILVRLKAELTTKSTPVEPSPSSTSSPSADK